MGRLDGKVALITGAARGQGLAEAQLFCQEGASVILTDVLDDLGAEAAKAMGASYFSLNVTDENAWQSVVDEIIAEHKTIDVLINNAGILHTASLLDTTLADYQRVIDINQIGVFLGMRIVAATMKSTGNTSLKRPPSRRGAALIAAIRIASGNARFTTTSLTG